MYHLGRNSVLIALSLITLLTLTACGQAVASKEPSIHPAATTDPTIPDPYLPHQGTLALNDPLKDNSLGYQWDVEKNECWFAKDGYHDATAVQDYNFWCAAFATRFSNFVYEAQMTILKAGAGGLIFRADANDARADYFRIDQTGYFMFIVYTGHTSPSILAEGNVPASANFHTGLDRTNLLAVAAQGDHITLYVNHHPTQTVTDSTYSQGQVGVGAFDNTSPIDVAFTHARVWKL